MAARSDIPLFDETTTWLLESQTPSIRLLTLKNLLGKAETDAEVRKARLSVSSTPPVTKIMAAQDPDGFWVQARHIYSPKYRSTHWTMILLTELALDPHDAGLQKGAEFMQTWIQGEMPQYLRRTEAGFGCFWGNWLRYQLYCGKEACPLTQQVIDFVCADLERGGECRYNSGLPCAWAVARGLYGLALLPEGQRGAKARSAIQSGLDFLLKDDRLLTGNYPADCKPHEFWNKLSFPLFYHADKLFILRVLKELHALDHPAALSAKDWLKEKRTKTGIWRGGSPLSSRTRPFVVKPDNVDRWITLQALEVLS